MKIDKIYEALKASGLKVTIPGSDPTVTQKGWGKEFKVYSKSDEILNIDFFDTVKVLYFEKGKKCSLHYHSSKFEIFVMLIGALDVNLVYDACSYSFVLREGENFVVPQNLIHQMTGLNDVNILLELSTKDRAEDSYRIQRGD